jgi:hypothetical protein
MPHTCAGAACGSRSDRGRPAANLERILDKLHRVEPPALARHRGALDGSLCQGQSWLAPDHHVSCLDELQAHCEAVSKMRPRDWRKWAKNSLMQPLRRSEAGAPLLQSSMWQGVQWGALLLCPKRSKQRLIRSAWLRTSLRRTPCWSAQKISCARRCWRSWSADNRRGTQGFPRTLISAQHRCSRG